MIDQPPASLVKTETQYSITETFIVETNRIAFALKKISKTHACNIAVFPTENTELLV